MTRLLAFTAVVLGLSICGGAESEDSSGHRVEVPLTHVMALDQSSAPEWAIESPGDLRLADGVSFEFRTDDLAHFERFIVSFRSGRGRYWAFFDPGEAGKWNRVTVLKSDCFQSEGAVAGWGDVKMLTIGGQFGNDPRPKFGIANVRQIVRRPEILVIRGDSSLPKFTGDRHDRLAATMTKFLVDMGAAAVQISDLEVCKGIPDTVRLVVLPSNPSMPETSMPELERFARKGGMFIGCYNLDSALCRLMGVELGGYYDRRRHSGAAPIMGLVRDGKPLPGSPDFVPGRLCSLFRFPRDARMRPLAAFADANHTSVDLTALVQVPGGFYVASLWEFWGAEARALMRSLLLACEPSWKDALMAAELACAAEDARVRDWLHALKPKEGEVREMHCHAADGLSGKTWGETVALIKAGGFNVVSANVAWGNRLFREEARQLQEACRTQGVQCGFWKVCWRRHHRTDAAFPGRAMKNFSGKVDPTWMCPSDPLNRKSELEQFLELAHMKPDRIYFDYIRYPNGWTCACDGCRAKFERATGLTITNWTCQVRKDPAVWQQWLGFRRDVITSFVRETVTRIRSECPGVKLSAFVSPYVDTSRNWRGLDWVEWCREGLLDNVAPMDYYFGNQAGLRELLKRQREVDRLGKTRLLPTFGLYEWPQIGRDAERLAREILLAREYGFEGFGVFQVCDRALDVFAELHAGVTAE